MGICGDIDIAKELDEKLVNHISRGNMKAYEIIKEFHMEEVRCIRTYMASLLYDLSNPRELNALFHTAVRELGINLTDLLIPGLKIVSDKEEAIKLAM